MRKSTFAIVAALVVALCVPAVAFAALAPSPLRAHPGADAASVAAAQPKADRAVPSGGGNGSQAQRGYGHPEGCQGSCDAFADVDGDGVCDHCADSQCPNYVDANEDGICDHCAPTAEDEGAAASAPRPGFNDADGDGMCDNYDEGCPGGHGCRNGDTDGAHHGQGHGCWQ